MNEAGSPSQQHELGSNNNTSNRQTIGQVAQHAKTFSQTSSVPTTFGKYDSFYLSLRKSENNSSRQCEEQKRWLRKHQYRGDEMLQKSCMMASLVLSPEVDDDTSEDCDIEGEAWCIIGGGGTSCDEVPVLYDSHAHASTLDLNPRIRNINDQKTTSTKQPELTPINIDDEFMDLTLKSSASTNHSSRLLSKQPSIITPDASSLKDSLKSSSHFKDSSTESMASSFRYRSPSDLYLESNMHNMSDICKTNDFNSTNENIACFHSPDRRNNNTTNNPEQLDLTPLSKAIIVRSGSRKSREADDMSSPDLTPLSKAILRRRKKSIDFADVENLCRNRGM